MKYAKDFRASARGALKGKWWPAVLAGFLAVLLGAAKSSSFSIDFSSTSGQSSGSTSGTTVITTQDILKDPELYRSFLTVFGIVFGVILVVGIIRFIVGSIVSPGYAQFNLDLVDGNTTEIRTLFSYSVHWKKLIATNFLRGLFTFLWMLLFIIPGIVAIYNYAMVPYILAENPTMAPIEAIAQSKRMMYGNRWRLFCLEISFIGWMILTVFTFGIGGLWLTPYMQAAFADFYREISNTRPENDIEIEIIEEA